MCWFPTYVLPVCIWVIAKIGKDYLFELQFWLYAHLIRLPLQILYSQLNPVMYLVVFKQSRILIISKLKQFSNYVLNATCFKLCDKKENVSKLGNFGGAAIILFWSLGFSCFAISIVLQMFSARSIGRNLLSEKEMPETHKHWLQTSINYWDLTSKSDPRIECFENHGVIKRKTCRCYLFRELTHEVSKDSQLEDCENVSMTLTYPRSNSDLAEIAEVAFQNGAHTARFHVGLSLENVSNTSNLYESNDRKFSFISPTDKWFVDLNGLQLTGKYLMISVEAFQSPPYTLSSTNKKMLGKRYICSFDF